MTSLEAPSTSSRLAGRETAAGTQRDAHDCAEDVKDYPPNARPERADTAADSTTEKKAEARAVIAPQPPEPAPALRSNDFYFLPIPKSRRYDPDKPVPFSPFLNYLFAFASTFTVANLYYCQPLLIQYSDSFGVSYEEATHIPTLLQGGYAGGLLLITPLGDLIRRRSLILLLVAITTLLSIGLAVTESFHVFQALNFITGFCTVAPQVLIPLAADLSPVARRAQSMAIVLSGLLLGILCARVLAGIVAEFASWRNVYYMAIGTQALVWATLWAALPDYPPKNPDLKYLHVFPTMAKFICTNPVLVHGSILSGIGSALFSAFWVTLTFLLADAPYNYSTLVIGLFGLVGIAGVCTAPLVGKLVDRLVPWVGALLGNLCLIIANILLAAGAKANIAVVVIAILVQDAGQQLNQVSNQSRIFSTNPAAGSRLNSIYIIALFAGQLVGSSLLSKIYLARGVRVFYGVNLALLGVSLVVLAARGPLRSNTKWLGWGGKDDWQLVKRPEKQNQCGSETGKV